MSHQTPTIQLIPVRQNGVFKKWNMSVNGGAPGGPGNYPHVQVGKGDDATMTFTIVNPQGIVFAPTTATTGPVYIQAGTSKPTSGVDGQFQPITVASSGPNAGTSLTMPDSNQTAGPYTYQLNFTGAPPLDPIVDNGGPGLNFNLVFVALGAIALIALAVLILRPMMRKQQPDR